MVHALREIRRVLVPNGIMIDLRPVLSHWPVEVKSERETRTTGRIQDLPLGLADDAAANKSVANAEHNKWFVREAEECFPFYYSWDSPSEMEEWIAEEWHEFIELDDESTRATRSAWALGDADSAVRVGVNMLITRWRKE